MRNVFRRQRAAANDVRYVATQEGIAVLPNEHTRKPEATSRWNPILALRRNRTSKGYLLTQTLEASPTMTPPSLSKKILKPSPDRARRFSSVDLELDSPEVAIVRGPIDEMLDDTPKQKDAKPEDFLLSSTIKKEEASSPLGRYRPSFGQPASSSDSHHSQQCLDPVSLASSGGLTEDLNDLNKRFLDLAILRPRSRLLVRSNSEPCFGESQHRTTYRQHDSSTPQDQPTESSSKPTSDSSTSSSSPSAASALSPTLSGGTWTSIKRRRDDPGDQGKRQGENKRLTQDASTPRLACFYNKYDPLRYGLGAHTYQKFKACEGRFENMNRLYEHLERVHSDTFAQCPMCARIGFRTPEELLAHQTASEPCIRVSMIAVKRIEWMSSQKRQALKSAVNVHATALRRVGTCTEEDKWRFGYRWLFETNSDNVPSPYPQAPVLTGAAFAFDRFEELIGQSSDLDDLARRFSNMRIQYSAQHGISRNDSGTDLPPFPSARTTSGSTSLERPALHDRSLSMFEPRDLGSVTQDHRDQIVSPMPLYQPCATSSTLEPSSAPVLSQARPSRAKATGTTSSHESTDARYSRTDTPHADTKVGTGPPKQWPSSLPIETAAQEYHLLDSMEAIPSAVQSHRPIQVVPPCQYPDNWRQDDGIAWSLDQDTLEIVGTRNDMSQDFMTETFFDTGLFDGHLGGHGYDGLSASQVSTIAGL